MLAIVESIHAKRKVEHVTDSQEVDVTAKREKKRKVRNWVKILSNFDIIQARVAIDEKAAYLKREVSSMEITKCHL